MVTLGGSRPMPTLVAMLKTDFIHSVSAIGMWMVQKEFEIAILAEFLCCSICYCVLYWNLKVFLRYKLPDHSIILHPCANSTTTGESRWVLSHISSVELILVSAVAKNG